MRTGGNVLKELSKIKDTGKFNMKEEVWEVLEYAHQNNMYELREYVGYDVNRYFELLKRLEAE